MAAVFGAATSCTDILDTAPNDKLSSSTMWTTESSVDQGVIGVYYSLKNPFPGNKVVGVDAAIGYYGFDAYGMTGQGEYGMLDLFTRSVNPSNTVFLKIWQWLYDGVHRANAAIAGIPGAPIDDAKKARLVAECKVLRAFFYTRLNLLYGNNGLGVPLYTEPVDNPDECNKVQSPESEVWAQVVQDLTDAINESNLPDNQIDGEGRVSKGAAYALRGEAYLLMKDYEKAAQDFEQVGKCGYGLFGDYKQLFKEENERCEEMILSLQYIEDPSGYGTAIQKYWRPLRRAHRTAAAAGPTCR